jgi:hypothetical protein
MPTAASSPDLQRRLQRVIERIGTDAPHSPSWAADMAEYDELAEALGLRADAATIRLEVALTRVLTSPTPP